MKPGYDGSIRIDTNIDAKGFNQGITGITKSMAKLGKVFAASQIAKMVIETGKAAINIASDLQEVQNVVETAFGDMTYQVEEFADTAIDKFGMSELAAKRTASTYMAMSKGMGIAGQAAADMAIDVAGLTGDVASFYNVSQDVADNALKSIWTGETESLKQFGVVMTQANLQQFAYARGINKKISAMTQAEQVMLRYQFVTQQLGLAQGDFAKTSGSWANQTRILSERWKELLGILGTGLMEVGLPIVKFLNTILEILIRIFGKIGDIYNALTGKKLVKSNKQIADSANYAADSEFGLADGINDAAKAAKKALAPFDELNILQGNLGSGGGGGFDSGLTFPSEFDDGIQEAGSNIKGLKEEFDAFFVDINNRFRGLGQTLAVPLYVPAPVFAPIANPVYQPNWGFDGTPIQVPAPVFEPIPNPVYEPVWNLNSTLQTETGLVYQTITAFSENLHRSLSSTFANVQLVYNNALVGVQVTSANVISNAQTMSETVASNFQTWKERTSTTVSQWATNVTNAVYQTASNSISNVNSFLQTTHQNISSWANTSSKNLAAWGNGMLEISRATAKGFVENFVGGLQIAWSNFKSFMSKTGEKISSYWTANKSWLAPTIVITGGALALGAIALSGGSLAPALAAIPMLATGAVIPPNSEFLAILGDQKSGRNIETPEALLRQIMREENGNGQVIGVLQDILDAIRTGKVLVVDKQVLAKVVNNAQSGSFRMAGSTTIPL